MGDPAGIGPEVIAKAWARRETERLPPFVAVGDPRAIERVWRGPIARIETPGEAAAIFDGALPVMAVTDAVAKAQLYAIGFTHPGQTEFVAERCGVAAENAVMMLAGPTLRVVPVTTHVPLAAVRDLLTIDLVVNKARAAARGLTRNFAIERPRLAFAGFNPHAGEAGALGREEIEILMPAIHALQADGIDAVGPFAADTMFHARARGGYDVAICCYHDQALIPLKTLHFDEGVNMTLGLPIVRTSPDHGTAFDLAGTDRAEPGAMIAAIRLAAEAAAHRAETAA
ncbi:4-hydroxythreonine-4-phosphate dehydrogenase PdxA [Sphingomonas sp. CCH16-B10]|uniref:4-hydroxythreonine-4-phosphate dehydrogenase PdxA n=1 Tax=Sphingomonas sp. CCH16-B10 TaxID=1768755 RepID=UPI00082B1FF5|nr:4-hydroxythreonine-4-phosphate dehydrogenase PdxA [Sphingomonas sp. CCH16-B10]